MITTNKTLPAVRLRLQQAWARACGHQLGDPQLQIPAGVLASAPRSLTAGFWVSSRSLAGRHRSQRSACRRTTFGRSYDSVTDVGGTKTVEVVYVITSADALSAPPRTLAAWVQNHWGIENRCHWVRDVTFDEDRSRARTGHAPQVMACLRDTAISLLRLDGATNIAAALRHHAARLDRPIKLVLTS